MFCHLHTHSHYSRLDGLGTVKELVERAMELGQTALAITDHGSCSGLYDLMKYTEGTPVKPIFGCEFYFNTKEDEKYSHLILLAKDQVGLTNIFKLHEYGYVHGFKMKPRINLEMLKKHSEGIVCLSACIGNIIPRALLEGNEDYAYEWAMTFKRIFGEDFYIELQDNTLDTQKFVNQKLVKLANKINVEIVATNDVHYTLKEDAEVHDTMLCMQTNAKKHDEKRWRFPSRDFWLKSEDEMKLSKLSKEDRERALNNTMVIADKCNAKLIKGSYLPKFYNVPEGKTEERLLREEVTKRYKTEITDKGLHTKAYAEAVMKELGVIEQTGYSGYHLIVADFVNYARNNGILVGDGRGSGAGCKVAYIMGITRVEPEKHHLLFERFLAPGRVPDYDIDFADNNAIFSYLQDKYGVENVARIVAFGTLSAKAVARKVFSAFGHTESIIAQISGAIPSEVGITLDKAYSLSPDLVSFKKQYKEEFKHMERLEGRISHASQHAGGVIIYPNLSSYIPVHTDSEDRNKRIVSFDKKMAEDMGFCKIDCLGLEALSTLNETVKSIEKLEGVAINFDEIDYEDPAIYEDLRRGDVYGLFQLENQKELTIKQQPKCFDDIVAISSICRPGTCDVDAYLERRTKQNFTIPPQEEWYMRKSEGLIIYQEQFLLHCKTYAGWDIAFADKNVRKNKGLKTDVDLRNKFINDCVSSGYTHDFAMSKWQEIVDVAGSGLKLGHFKFL